MQLGRHGPATALGAKAHCGGIPGALPISPLGGNFETPFLVGAAVSMAERAFAGEDKAQPVFDGE